MEKHAKSVLEGLKMVGVDVGDSSMERKMLASIKHSLSSIDVLTAAVKREILHLSSVEENNIDLTEKDAEAIAHVMVFDRDWSSFNEWIEEEIRQYMRDRKQE